MNAVPAYASNQENFAAFYALQNEFVRCLASHPGVIRDWLETQPPRQPREAGDPGKAPKAWRTARLSAARRRELLGLILRVEEAPAEAESLAMLLLAAMPVRTYLEIAEVVRPSLRAIDAQAGDLCCRLTRLRECLFMTNYGLAQAAARQRNRSDPSDLLSAASCGLLDAIDRYVPDARAARFGYFASYWIRYHLSRHSQKYGSVVSFPINQHRIGHRIDRYLAARQVSGLPAPSDAELCADLKLGCDAFYWHHLKPQVYSFENFVSHDPRAATAQHFLCDPAPGPAAVMEEAETAGQLISLLHAAAPPAIRVMLAYARNIGSLADAAGDYLTHLHEMAMDRIRPLSRTTHNPNFAGASPDRVGVNDSPAFGIACDPVFRVKRAVGNP